MGEICILHAADSRDMACRMASRLAEEGHSVIRRDHDDLAAGSGRLGAAADAVVAIWSPAVRAGSALLDDAREALARRVLAPVAIGGAEPPRSFAHLWPIDLDGWAGDADDPRWQFVRDEIDLARRRVEQHEAAADEPRAPQFKPYRYFAPAAAILAIASATAIVRLTPATPASAAEEPAMLAHFAPIQDPGAAPQMDDPTVSESPPAAPSLRDADLSSAVTLAAIEPEMIENATDMPMAPGAEDTGAEIAAPPPERVAGDFNPDAEQGAPQDIDGAVGGEAALLVDLTEAPAATTSLEPETAQADAGAGFAVAAGETEVESIEPLPLPAPAPDTFAGLVFRDCADCPDMVEIPAGIAPPATPDGKAQINPSPFALSRREVTFAEWDACVEAAGCAWRAPDAGWGRGDQPVINVSREDALAYIRWLSTRTGRDYRLPSEEEWEYAALGGGSDPRTEGRSVSPLMANYEEGALARPAPTKRYAPSVYGLYDMLGNVWEWTADCDAASGGLCQKGVAKGGAYDSEAWRVSASARVTRNAAARTPDTGFRVARSLP